MKLTKALLPGKVLYKHKDIPVFSPWVAVDAYKKVESAFDGNVRLYDPFCGNGVTISTMQALNNNQLEHIYGSDITDYALETTQKNLQILTKDGIEQRIKELRQKNSEGIAENLQKYIN